MAFESEQARMERLQAYPRGLAIGVAAIVLIGTMSAAAASSSLPGHVYAEEPCVLDQPASIGSNVDSDALQRPSHSRRPIVAFT